MCQWKEAPMQAVKTGMNMYKEQMKLLEIKKTELANTEIAVY